MPSDAREFTHGAKLVQRPDGRYEIDIRGRLVPSPRGEGWTLFQAETVLDRLEQRCREIAPEVVRRLVNKSVQCN